MTSENETNRVWNLMEKIGICMFTTRDGDQIRARPMAAHVRREENVIYFLTDVRDHKDDEVDAFHGICLSFSDTSGQKYAAVTGEAEVSNDRAKIRDLWSFAAKAWWKSADDTNIRLLTVRPTDAQYWDGPGSVVSAMKMASAAVTGRRPDMGENRKVQL